MSDHDALLGGVLANPDADLPRLVYADFLEETGTPGNVARAEFVRVQVELASAGPDEARRLELRIRDRLLLNEHVKAWLAPLRAKGEALQNPGTHGLFRRGLVETVWMPATVFTWKAAKLFARAPVTELRVTRTTLAELEDLLREPTATHLTALDLCDRRLGDAAVRAVVGSPLLANLQTLRLRACGLTADAVEPLLEAPAAWRPERLELGLNAIPPAGLALLRERYADALA